jgi:site-specific DNA-cytosine methylase
MKVISLFDGISCAQQALKQLGIEIGAYYAAEIEPTAIAQTIINHPGTIHIGDVREVKASMFDSIDLLIGGSPCQDLSQAKAKNRQGLKGTRSALFWEYLRILKEIKPRWWVLENVASMRNEDRDIISKELGVEPIMIDAALVSAQQRKRYFWSNIPISLPEDKGLVVKDFLIPGIERKYIQVENPIKTSRGIKWDKSGKGYFSQQDRAYSINGKFPTIPTARTITKANIIFDDGRIGVLDYMELEALMGLPHGYTKDIRQKERRGGAIGNGFHVEVIKHILKNLTPCPHTTRRTEK